MTITKRDGSHDVFLCPCGDHHCSQDSDVSECADDGVFGRLHCDDYDCGPCQDAAAREYQAEQEQDIRRYGP